LYSSGVISRFFASFLSRLYSLRCSLCVFSRWAFRRFCRDAEQAGEHVIDASVGTKGFPQTAHRIGADAAFLSARRCSGVVFFAFHSRLLALSFARIASGAQEWQYRCKPPVTISVLAVELKQTV